MTSRRPNRVSDGLTVPSGIMCEREPSCRQSYMNDRKFRRAGGRGGVAGAQVETPNLDITVMKNNSDHKLLTHDALVLKLVQK